MKHRDKLDTYYKIKMVLDKELAGDWQYAECINKICKVCKEKT